MKKRNEIIIPVISIVTFCMLLFGASYAFYNVASTTTTDVNNIATINAELPKKCSITASSTNCSLSGQTSTTVNLNDNIISSVEMLETYAGNSIAKSTCSITINKTGDCGLCSYDLNITPVSGYEFTGIQTPSGKNYDAIKISGIPVNENSINIGTQYLYKNQTTSKHDFVLNYYNLNIDQSSLSNKSYIYNISVADMKCNIVDNLNTTYNHNGIIPTGGTYYRGADFYDYSDEIESYSAIWEAGDEFPEPQTGDVYQYNGGSYFFRCSADYEHNCYPVDNDGWTVNYSKRILDSINGYPVDYMYDFTNGYYWYSQELSFNSLTIPTSIRYFSLMTIRDVIEYNRAVDNNDNENSITYNVAFNYEGTINQFKTLVKGQKLSGSYLYDRFPYVIAATVHCSDGDIVI